MAPTAARAGFAALTASYGGHHRGVTQGSVMAVHADASRRNDGVGARRAPRTMRINAPCRPDRPHARHHQRLREDRTSPRLARRRPTVGVAISSTAELEERRRRSRAAGSRRRSGSTWWSTPGARRARSTAWSIGAHAAIVELAPAARRVRLAESSPSHVQRFGDAGIRGRPAWHPHRRALLIVEVEDRADRRRHADDDVEARFGSSRRSWLVSRGWNGAPRVGCRHPGTSRQSASRRRHGHDVRRHVLHASGRQERRARTTERCRRRSGSVRPVAGELGVTAGRVQGPGCQPARDVRVRCRRCARCDALVP